MLSLGGAMGTGLFMGSGEEISQAGPLGAVLAYIIGGGDCIYGHALPRGACSTFTCFWFIWCLCNTLYWPWHRLYGVVDVLARLVGNTWHRIYRSSHFGTGMVPAIVNLVMDVNLCQWRFDFKPQFNPSFCRV